MEQNEKIIDNDYIKVEKRFDSPDFSKDHRYVKLADATASRISGLLQGIPMAAAGAALSGAYRVEFPKGIAGVLTPHGDGYLAIIRDPETKKYLGQGTLYGLEGAAAVYSLFSVLSVVTNQYYLEQINHQLTDIQEGLDKVLNFLYTDKACELYAEAQAVFGLYQNYTSIMACSEQRIASLQTVQKARILADRNIQFYDRDMYRLAVGKGTPEELQDDLNYYTQAISLYGVCSVLEVVLSQNLDENYLDFMEKDLKHHMEAHLKRIGLIQGVIIAKLKAVAPAPFAKPKPDHKWDHLRESITHILGEGSPVKGFDEVINQIREDSTDKAEYQIDEKGFVYKRCN